MDIRTENILRYINNHLDTALEEGLITSRESSYAHDVLSFISHVAARDIFKLKDTHHLLEFFDEKVRGIVLNVVHDAYEFANEEEKKLADIAKEVNDIANSQENSNN